MAKEKNFVSAVIYIHNAEKRINKYLTSLVETLENNFEHSEIICVNDCSCDSSVSIIKEVSKKAVSTSVSILHMSHYHGLEMAMNAGVDLAIGDFVFEFDTTFLDYDSREIMSVYKKSLEGYDIVSASPMRTQKITSQMFYKIYQRFAKISYEMQTESFRILSRRVINRINSMHKEIPYRKAVYYNCGLKTIVMKYEEKKQEGMNGCKASKEEEKYRRRLAVDTLILFTDLGYRFSIGMAIFMVFVAVFMLIYSCVVYIMSTPVAGWTTTILFLSIAFFGLFVIFTIVIKYLQILVDLLYRRKRYSFEGIEKLTK